MNQNQPSLLPHNERRYIVGYDPSNEGEITKVNVFVVDKLSNQKIVYKATVTERKKAYPAIERIYGKADCIPPKPLNIRLFM